MAHRRERRKRLLRWALISLILILALAYELNKVLAPRTGALEITIVYGSEKQRWMEEVIPLFQEWWMEQHGEPIVVRGIPMGSGESMNQILHTQILPTVWSPAASIWIPLANYLWREIYPKYYREYGDLVQEWKPLVYSPIVIITWEKFQEEYGVAGFESLHRLAASSHSKELKFAHTDPRLSNSGFLSVVLEVSVAAGKNPEELTMDDLTREDVRSWLRALESRGVLYGRSTGFLVKHAVLVGPEGINALIAYENLVIDENMAGEPLARWGQKLVAVYPEEGTLLSDHPYCILNAPWVSREQREAAQELLEFLLRPEIQARAMKHGFRPVADVPLDSSIFNEDYGVELELPCPVLSSNVSGEVLWRITDLWVVVRTYGGGYGKQG